MKRDKKTRMNFKGIIDTTLRDGQQSPLLYDAFKYRFNLDEKKLLIKGLVSLGIRHIELFSPVVSKAEKDDFIAIKKYTRSIAKQNVLFLAHCRCIKQEIEQALELGFDGLHLYMGISQYAQRYSYGKKFNEVRKLIKNTVQTTRREYPHLYIRFSTEDAFRTPLRDVFETYDDIYPFVDTLGLPDTVGVATPELVKQRVEQLRDRYPDIKLECHFHNDRGFALVNAVAAVEAGVEYIDASIWGLAERSGITSITGLLLNLYYLDETLTKKYNFSLCYPLNVLMASILRMQVPYNEPVSLTNRTHVAGVHQKAVINNNITYEANNLEKFGVTKNQLLLGPLSGWNLIYYYLKEVGNYNISPQIAKEIAETFKSKVDDINGEYKPEKLLQKVLEEYSLTKKVVPETYAERRLENLT